MWWARDKEEEGSKKKECKMFNSFLLPAYILLHLCGIVHTDTQTHTHTHAHTQNKKGSIELELYKMTW